MWGKVAQGCCLGTGWPLGSWQATLFIYMPCLSWVSFLSYFLLNWITSFYYHYYYHPHHYVVYHLLSCFCLNSYIFAFSPSFFLSPQPTGKDWQNGHVCNSCFLELNNNTKNIKERDFLKGKEIGMAVPLKKTLYNQSNLLNMLVVKSQKISGGLFFCYNSERISCYLFLLFKKCVRLIHNWVENNRNVKIKILSF